jgi:hypothetical protein
MRTSGVLLNDDIRGVQSQAMNVLAGTQHEHDQLPEQADKPFVLRVDIL